MAEFLTTTGISNSLVDHNRDQGTARNCKPLPEGKPPAEGPPGRKGPLEDRHPGNLRQE